jgi:outer membrane protein TolC
MGVGSPVFLPGVRVCIFPNVYTVWCLRLMRKGDWRKIMKEMRNCISLTRLIGVFITLATLAASSGLRAGVLSLESAEALALGEDPGLQSVQANRRALDELAIAGEQLPDPVLKMGIAGLPVDTFHLGQEAMTQVQIGVVQKFPRGHTRSLRAEQIRQRSAVMDETLHDQKLQILLAVREQYIEVQKQVRLAAINQEAETVFSELADITRDYYATGRVQQQDVLRTGVELARIQDRSTQIHQEEDRARARLTTWIGAAAHREIQNDWPKLDSVLAADQIRDQLAEHPRIRSLQQNVVAADTGVELARQAYKPEFSLDVTYGGRGGSNPDGSSRADLLGVMVMMDMPLFSGNRQDRVTAARVAESSAAMFNRDDIYRRMQSEIDFHAASLQRQSERIKLFNRILLPDARFNAEAAFDAYQAAVADLTTLMRARITEYELQREYVGLQAELLKTKSRLLYFEGAL